MQTKCVENRGPMFMSVYTALLDAYNSGLPLSSALIALGTYPPRNSDKVTIEEVSICPKGIMLTLEASVHGALSVYFEALQECVEG